MIENSEEFGLINYPDELRDASPPLPSPLAYQPRLVCLEHPNTACRCPKTVPLAVANKYVKALADLERLKKK